MKNKVAIITGGSRGIGAGISKAFFDTGYNIVINYRNDASAAKALKESLGGSDERILLVQADIGISADRQRLVTSTINHFGAIDVLVNNAGIAARGSFLKGTEEEFDAIINTNLKGPVFLAQACAKQMIESNTQGNIVNISSVSGHMSNAPTSYCAAKAGLTSATKNMALKLGPHGIRVNTVTPGNIRSDMNKRAWKDNPEVWAEKMAQSPLQRGGEPPELASAVLYLASDEASYVTGSELIVDGGWMLQPLWS